MSTALQLVALVVLAALELLVALALPLWCWLALAVVALLVAADRLPEWREGR